MPSRGEAFSEWKQQFKDKLSKQLSPEEIAVFLSILQGFSQTQQNLEKNAEIVASAAQAGKFSFWGETFALKPEFFTAVDFKNPKWKDLSREAMQALHGQAKVHPASMRFFRSQEEAADTQAFAAQTLLESVKGKVIRKLNEKND